MIRPTRVAALAAILPALVAGQEPRTHTVVRGNTLWAIAGQYVGDPYEWPRIHAANIGLIPNPHRIYPGWEVVIPGPRGAGGEAPPPPSGDREAGAPVGTTSGADAAPPDQGPAALPPQAPTAFPNPAPAASSAAAPSSASENRPFVDAQVPPQGVGPARTVFYRERPLQVGGIAAAAPVWEVTPEQFYSAPWLIPPGTVPESFGVVESLERGGEVLNPRTTARVYDRVRLAVAGPLPAVGARVQSMRVTRAILGVGQVVLPTGILLVEELTPTGVVAVVETQFDRISLGDLVRALPTYVPVPAGSTVPAAGEAEVDVIAFQTDREVQTYGDYAFLAAGSAAGVRIGDEYVTSEEASASARASAARFKVVAVLEDVATARIVELENPVFPRGVRLRPDRRVR